MEGSAMSAFQMDKQFFNRLASELFAHATLEHSKLNWSVKHNLDLRTGDFDVTENRIRTFVQRLYAANIEAVNQRYSEGSEVPTLSFTPASGLPKWSDEQLFKHLECLSYQCAEGDVPETEIYAQLEALIGAIARSIVGSSEKYKASKWDFE
jgi:hypothetical protein